MKNDKNANLEDEGMTLGERLKKARKALPGKVTQEQIAKQIDSISGFSSGIEGAHRIDPSMISRWENDEREPDRCQIKLLCKVYGCDYGYLMEDYDEFTVEVHSLQELTGLSATACQKLMDWGKEFQNKYGNDIIPFLDSLIRWNELSMLAYYYRVYFDPGTEVVGDPESYENRFKSKTLFGKKDEPGDDDKQRSNYHKLFAKDMFDQFLFNSTDSKHYQDWFSQID